MYLYSDEKVILGEKEVFTSENEDNSDLVKDVSHNVSPFSKAHHWVRTYEHKVHKTQN